MLDCYNSNIFHTALSGQPQMLSILLNSMQGYNTQGCKILSKEGHELDEHYLQQYRCVHCKFILRRPYQLICGDRICKNCLPSRYVRKFIPICMYARFGGQFPGASVQGTLAYYVLSVLSNSSFCVLHALTLILVVVAFVFQ